MKLSWKLRERLTLLSLCTGLLPLLAAIIYLVHSSSVIIEELSINYMKSEISGFARTAEARYSAVMASVNIEQIKTLKDDLPRA